MIGYITYFLAGLASVWLTLFMWGFSAGPATPAPWYRLVCSLVVWVCASALSLHYTKPAALLALACTTITIATAVVYESFWALLSPIDLAVVVCATVTLFRRSRERWLALTARPGFRLRLILSVVPLVVCCFMVNLRLVGPLILAGPPPQGGGLPAP